MVSGVRPEKNEETGGGGGGFLLDVLGVQYFIYDGWSKIFRPDQLFKLTDIKQICYFSI